MSNRPPSLAQMPSTAGVTPPPPGAWSRAMDRMAIGSLTDLKRAYEDELAVHHDEIVAEVEHILAIGRGTNQRITTKAIHERRECAACGGPIEGARRLSRWFCSDRCRQRAYRQRQHAEAA
jgi:hypothetical protein